MRVVVVVVVVVHRRLPLLTCVFGYLLELLVDFETLLVESENLGIVDMIKQRNFGKRNGLGVESYHGSVPFPKGWFHDGFTVSRLHGSWCFAV